MNVVLLSGGGGGARFARGLDDVLGAGELAVIGNVGDDEEILGLHVSPDLDSLLYTLAGLVDEERGIVLAAGFIDHSGRLDEYQLTDGRKVKSPVRRPHSFYFMELFKIEAGAIRQIEANFITVPYNMPSPWDSWGP